MGNKPVKVADLRTIQTRKEMDKYLSKHNIKDNQICEIIVDCIMCNMSYEIFYPLLKDIGVSKLNENYDLFKTYLTNNSVSRHVIEYLTEANLIDLVNVNKDQTILKYAMLAAIRFNYLELLAILIKAYTRANRSLSEFYPEVISKYSLTGIETFCKYDPGFDIEKLMTKTQQRAYEMALDRHYKNANNAQIAKQNRMSHHCDSSNPMNTMMNTVVAVSTARAMGVGI